MPDQAASGKHPCFLRVAPDERLGARSPRVSAFETLYGETEQRVRKGPLASPPSDSVSTTGMICKARGALAALFLLYGACTAAATDEIQTLSATGDRLQAAFNERADVARLVLIFSPT